MYPIEQFFQVMYLNLMVDRTQTHNSIICSLMYSELSNWRQKLIIILWNQIALKLVLKSQLELYGDKPITAT